MFRGESPLIIQFIFLTLILTIFREIQIMRRLNHKNVVKLFETLYNHEKEKLYLVMEYCAAVLQDLLDSVPERKLPIFQASE